MATVIPRQEDTLFDLARRCDALYICPKVAGRRKGPLVIYAGKDGNDRNLVGDIYFNFRKIESHPYVVERFASVALDRLKSEGHFLTFDTICGIPQGGRTFGQALAYAAGKRFVYADKKPKPTPEGMKQEYSWDLSQFDFEPGERVAIAEDVFNNFQNTDTTLNEIAGYGVKVVALVGALNRSPYHDRVYVPKSGLFAKQHLPVVTSIREAYPEYTQDDPEVAEDIAAGNLETKVKANWRRLMALMDAA